MRKNQEIKIFFNPDALFEFAANDFMQRAIAGVRDKGKFSVVLSGGNTPKVFFDTLTNDESYKTNIPWQNIQFFFGDERYVASSSEQSNYHMAYEHLFSKVPVNEANIFRVPTELNDPNETAKHYEQTLRKEFDISGNTFPQFDLLYLGLGDNAHTASLMPLSDVVKQYADNSLSVKSEQLVASLWVPELNMYRITLTPPAINHSMNIIFLVTGEDKSNAVWEVLEGPINPTLYPAQLIHGNTIWYLDQAAAGKLTIKQ